MKRREVSKSAKPVMTVDSALFICMSLGVAYNIALEKGANSLAKSVKRKLKSFVFKHLAVCKQAADKFKAMNDDERSEFVKTYQLPAGLEKEINM